MTTLRPLALRFSVAGLMSLLPACGDNPAEGSDSSTSDADADASADGEAGSASGSATGTTSGEPCDGYPTLEKDIVPIFVASCGSADSSCHARDAYGADLASECRGWLTLEDELLGGLHYNGPNEGQPTGCQNMSLFERLTILDAWNCEQYDARRKYVVPCEPDLSYVFHKIGGGPVCNIDTNMGSKLPSKSMPDGDMYTLSDSDYALIVEWITVGAPRDGEECTVSCSGGEDSGDETDSGDDEAGVNVPEVSINHPGNGEERNVNENIPFIGVATDVEDGDLSDASMVWVDSLEGEIGTGLDFGWAPTMTGTHTITLTATDSDSNEARTPLRFRSSSLRGPVPR